MTLRRRLERFCAPTLVLSLAFWQQSAWAWGTGEAHWRLAQKAIQMLEANAGSAPRYLREELGLDRGFEDALTLRLGQPVVKSFPIYLTRKEDGSWSIDDY